MSSLPRVLLDRTGDSIIPDGYTVIDSEVEFLTHALQSSSIVVVGDSLCRWAEELFRARDISFKYLKSPIDELCSLCRGLDREDAEKVIDAIGDKWSPFEEDVTPATVLKALYPDGPWDAEPSRNHAAQWLIWLDQTEPKPFVNALLDSMSDSWRSACFGQELPIYEVTSPEVAKDLLYQWLGIEPAKELSLGRFPLQVPEQWITRARECWRYELLQQGAKLFETLLNRSVPNQLLQYAAIDTFGYLKNHHDELNQEAGVCVQQSDSPLPPAGT